jgi:hypothetical protein
MKHSILTFGFLIFCSIFIYGQDNKLISSKQVSNRAEKSNEVLRKSEAYTSIDFVEIGAEFSATIESIYDCGESSSLTQKIIVQNVPEENDDMTDIQIKNKSDFSYTIYPNPTDEFINITYSLDIEMLLSIELVNLFGQTIRTVLPKQNQQAGTYIFQISVSDFSTGTYFLTISSTNQTKTEKIIINK